MNGYELSRSWFDFAFENNSKITPNHGILFFWLIEINNRLGWAKEFQITAIECMQGMGISKNSYKTYKRCLDDLVEWGFINLIKKSTNQYQCNVIALGLKPKALTKAKPKALTKALLKHNPKHIPKHNPYSINHKQKNNKLLSEFEIFRKQYPGRKRGLEIEFTDFKNKHKDYKQIVPVMFSLLNNQIKARKNAIGAKVFVPEWKNLKTWLQQRCWEEEPAKIEIKKETTQYGTFN